MGTPGATPPPPPPPPAPPGTRDKYLWPFASSSIWNMPIGSGAVFVPARIAPPTMQTLTTDQDIILMNPTAGPPTPIDYNGAGWSGGSRCSTGGAVLATVPMPGGFTVPSDGHNDALAAVMPDGRTVVQGQPFARCTPGGPATVLHTSPSIDLYTDGIRGAHGGSGLSSLGGTIRLNELVPGAHIRHALKVNIDGGADLFPVGWSWPAVKQDSCAPGCYGGKVPALKMGALLAIAPTVDINALGLQTEPARELAWTLQNYGAYVVDNAARSVFSIETECSPQGTVAAQFQQTWGFPFQAPAGSATPWSHDINVLIANLSVLVNNGPSSIGGGGIPRQPLAPPIGN